MDEINESLERWQAYLNNPTAPAEEAIIAFAAQEEKRLMKDISGRFKLLKENGTEKALFYNRYIETLRVYKTKEITEEEYKNNPLKKAYEDYAEAIPFRMTDLGSTCVIQATENTPDYKRAVDKAIKRAEKLITKIQKETGMNAEEMAFIAVDLIPAICELGYIIYHSQESDEYRAFKQKTESERKRISDKVQDPPTEADAAYIRQIKELNEAAERKWAEFESSFYKADKARSITEQILNRIFPEQKLVITRAIAKRPESETLDGYIHISNIFINKFVKQTLNDPKNVTSPRKGVITMDADDVINKTSITFNGNDGTVVTIELARAKELFKERVRGGAKLYNFFLQKSNEQGGRETTTFLLQELVDNGLYANKDSAYKGLKKITDKMMSMYIEGTQTIYDGGKKKQTRNAKAVIVAQRDISYNSCSISLPPIIRNNAKYITILPTWAYSLPENGFMLLDCIYYLARQNTSKIKENHRFTIGLEAVVANLGIPTPDKARANPGRLIIEPIEAAIEDIEGKSKGEIMITPIYNNGDYANVHEFLKGYLEIKLEERAENYMIEIARKQERKLKDAAKKQEQAALKAIERKEQESASQLKLPTE